MDSQIEVTIKKEFLDKYDSPENPIPESDLEHFNCKLEDLHHSIDIKDEFLESEIDYENCINNIFEEHSYGSQLPGMHYCIFCNFKSTRKWTLRVHLMGHKKPDEVQQCGVCFYFKSANKLELQKHIKSHFPDKTYSCRFCKYKCQDRTKYLAHINKKHTHKKHTIKNTPKKRFTCDICHYVCTTEPRFEDHARKHVNDCTTCKLCKSCSRPCIEAHFKEHSSETLCCANCNFKSSFKPTLTHHVKNHKTIMQFCIIHMEEHTGKTVFSCALCGYKSYFKTTLKTHIRQHTGETFSCADCDYEGRHGDEKSQ